MARKTINRIIELPFELDKIYKTKFANGDLFKIFKIDNNTAWGWYVGKEHIGLCPLDLTRLTATRIEESFLLRNACDGNSSIATTSDACSTEN